MSIFSNIAGIITFVKSTADLSKVAVATLGQDRGQALSLLLEETAKAAVSAALYNNPSRLLTALGAVKSGKKTASAKHWMESTTALMRGLPINASGDAKRITDEGGFIESVNAAIAAFNDAWVKFEEARVQRAKARKEATVAEPPAPTPEPAPAPTPAAVQPLTVDDEERADFEARIDKLNQSGLQLQASNDALTLTLARVTHERDTLKEAHDALLKGLEALKAELQALRLERDALLASRKRSIKKGLPA